MKNKQKGFTLIELMVVVVIIGILLAVGIPHTDKEGATRVLENDGYKNIKITGHAWFRCSKDDLYSTGFTATNLAGNYVEGTVCSGLFKGNTVRVN